MVLSYGCTKEQSDEAFNQPSTQVSVDEAYSEIVTNIKSFQGNDRNGQIPFSLTQDEIAIAECAYTASFQ